MRHYEIINEQGLAGLSLVNRDLPQPERSQRIALHHNARQDMEYLAEAFDTNYLDRMQRGAR